MSYPALLLQLPFKALSRLGLLADKKVSKAAFLIQGFMVFLFWVTILLLLIQFRYMENGDVNSYVSNFEGVLAFFQLTAKLCLFLYNKEKYLNLSSIINKFWSYDECSKTTQKDIQTTIKRVVLIQKLFLFSIVLIVVMVTPYSITHRILIVGYWQMDKDGLLFKLGWLAVFVTAACLTPFVGLYDGLYLGFCYEVQMQCKILYCHLEELNVEEITSKQQFKNYYKKLQTYIKHHVLLIEFHDELQKVYSVSLLVQYLTSSPFLCMEIYAVTEATNSFLLIRYISSCCCLTFQIAFYCIPANYMEHEMSTISTAIYNSNWYSRHFLRLRTPIILMIQRAQRRATLSACGLIEMNIEALVKLLKLGFSICIALKGLKNSNYT